MNGVYETPRDKTYFDLGANALSPQIGHSRNASTQNLNINPSVRYSISYLPQVSEKPIITGDTLEEAKKKVILLTAEVERLNMLNYSLVKENEFLRLDTDRPMKEKELHVKVAVVLAENEKLNQIIEDLYTALQNIRNNSESPETREKIDQLLGGKGIKSNASEVRDREHTRKVEELELKIRELSEENHKLKSRPVSATPDVVVDSTSVNASTTLTANAQLLLEENNKLNTLLEQKTREIESMKAQLWSQGPSQAEYTLLQSQLNDKNNEILILKASQSVLTQENESLKREIEELKAKVAAATAAAADTKITRSDPLVIPLLNACSELSDTSAIDDIDGKLTGVKSHLDELVQQRKKEIEAIQEKINEIDTARSGVSKVKGKVTNVYQESEKLVKLRKEQDEKADAAGVPQDLAAEVEKLKKELEDARKGTADESLVLEVQTLLAENEKLRVAINEATSKPVEAGSPEELVQLRIQSHALSATVERMTQQLSFYKQQYEVLRAAPSDNAAQREVKEVESEAVEPKEEKEKKSARVTELKKKMAEQKEAEEVENKDEVQVEEPHQDQALTEREHHEEAQPEEQEPAPKEEKKEKKATKTAKKEKEEAPKEEAPKEEKKEEKKEAKKSTKTKEEKAEKKEEKAEEPKEPATEKKEAKKGTKAKEEKAEKKEEKADKKAPSEEVKEPATEKKETKKGAKAADKKEEKAPAEKKEEKKEDKKAATKDAKEAKDSPAKVTKDKSDAKDTPTKTPAKTDEKKPATTAKKDDAKPAGTATKKATKK